MAEAFARAERNDCIMTQTLILGNIITMDEKGTMTLKPKTVTQDKVKALVLSLADADDASVAQSLSFAYAGDVPDYSLEDCWLQVPEITKDVDTFYYNNIKDNAAKRIAAYKTNR